MPPSAVESEIQRHAARVETYMRKLLPADAFPGLSEAAWYHLDTGGKRIRPALCLITCEAFGGDAERATPFAAAVELLHNMLLVHDDIEDGDEMRRNKPAVWKAYGLANGVNVGDFLLGRALLAILESALPEGVRLRLMGQFAETYDRTVQGQALDIAARGNDRFDVDAYLRMAELKTGWYLALGMVGGAIIADAPDATAQALRDLGSNLGPAFQIRDDLIDLTLGKGRGGVKGSDIREGKASILYAYALGHAAPNDAARLLDVIRKPREQTSDADVAWAIDLYERCGALRFAQETADRLIGDARAVLQRLPVERQAALSRLVDFIAERTT